MKEFRFQGKKICKDSESLLNFIFWYTGDGKRAVVLILLRGDAEKDALCPVVESGTDVEFSWPCFGGYRVQSVR